MNQGLGCLDDPFWGSPLGKRRGPQGGPKQTPLTLGQALSQATSSQELPGNRAHTLLGTGLSLTPGSWPPGLPPHRLDRHFARLWAGAPPGVEATDGCGMAARTSFRQELDPASGKLLFRSGSETQLGAGTSQPDPS